MALAVATLNASHRNDLPNSHFFKLGHYFTGQSVALLLVFGRV